MTISFSTVLLSLLRPFSHALAAQRDLHLSKPELSLEELRDRHRILLEQDLARERLRTSTALQRPFNGML